MNTLDVLKSPLLTEKLDQLREDQLTYAFKVDRRASKHDVKASAVECTSSRCTSKTFVP